MYTLYSNSVRIRVPTCDLCIDSYCNRYNQLKYVTSYIKYIYQLRMMIDVSTSSRYCGFLTIYIYIYMSYII